MPRGWSDVRDGWPAEPIKLYAPGADSGTFDYFTEAVVGKSQACRNDATFSENDHVLVQGIAGDEYSLGFFGYAYYVANKDKLKLVPIDNGSGPVAPSDETINNGTYAPLSRPIFIYPSVQASERPEVAAFVEFYLKNAPELVGEIGYVPLPKKVYELALERYKKRTTGSVFNKPRDGKSIEQLLAQ